MHEVCSGWWHSWRPCQRKKQRSSAQSAQCTTEQGADSNIKNPVVTNAKVWSKSTDGLQTFAAVRANISRLTTGIDAAPQWQMKSCGATGKANAKSVRTYTAFTG